MEDESTMTIIDYASVLKRGWAYVIVAVVLCIGAAQLANVLQPRIYQAGATIYIYAHAGGEFPEAVLEAGLGRMPSYRQLLTDDSVLEATIRHLSLDETPAELRSRVVVGNEPETLLLNLWVTDPVPDGAALVANTLADSFVEMAAELDVPETDRRQLITTARVLTYAKPPSSFVVPQQSTNLALGLLAGLILGIVAAFLRNALGWNVKSVWDLDEAACAPSLGIVAAQRTRRVAPLLNADGNPPHLWADFDRLAANLQIVDLAHTTKAVVMTSARPGVGTTTTTCNLAVALAAEGRRVALVDANLRRPGIAETMGVDGTVGLTAVLTRQVGLDQAMVAWNGAPGIDILPAGTAPPNPLEFLGSPHMASLIEKLRFSYEIVLFDSPSLLIACDAAVLAAKVDGAVLISRAWRTNCRDVASAREILEAASAPLLGTVLTFTSRREGRGARPPTHSELRTTYVDGSSADSAVQPTAGSERR